jgi:hypothetical protein
VVAVPAADAAAALRAALSCGRQGCACGRSANTHCPCPNHDEGDRHPSLTVHVLAGKLLVNCKKGTAQRELVAALKERGVWPDGEERTPIPPPPQPLERLVAVYQYITPGGEPAGEKGRFERPDGSKTFRWRKPGETVWSGGVKTAELPLYGAEVVAGADPSVPVWYVEGEKATEALHEQGQLAVTHGGGAGQKDFGDALEVLRGRDVLLWPDNDPAGRECMARLHGLLKPVARSLTVVQPAGLPEKGDAADYFGAGGAINDIIENLPPVRADVRHLAHDAVQVRVPTPMGVVSLTFTEMEKTARELAAELEVRLEGPGLSEEAYSQRLNLLSSSQRTELRRDLESLFSKDYKWPSVLNTALVLARTTYLEQDRGVVAADIADEEEQEFQVETLIPAGGPSLIFADGSSGKSYLCIRMTVAMAMAGRFAGFQAMRGGVLYVDYEDTEKNWKRRLKRVYRGLGFEIEPRLPIHYWPGRGIPLYDQIDAIKRKVLKDGISVVIIDAAADACGGEPEKADVASRYFNTLEKLPAGTTTITIAHVNNAAARAENADRAFGSTVWHNRPRMTWYVARVQEEESDVVDIGLYNKKANDGRKLAPVGIRLTFDGKNGPVTVERADIRETPQLQRKRGMREQIWEVLDRPLTIAQIGSEIDADPKTVATVLNRHKGRVFQQRSGTTTLGGRGNAATWARAAN